MRSYLEYHGSRHGKPPDSGSRNRHTGLSRSDQLVLCGIYGGLHAVPQHAERRFLVALEVTVGDFRQDSGMSPGAAALRVAGSGWPR